MILFGLEEKEDWLTFLTTVLEDITVITYRVYNAGKAVEHWGGEHQEGEFTVFEASSISGGYLATTTVKGVGKGMEFLKELRAETQGKVQIYRGSTEVIR